MLAVGSQRRTILTSINQSNALELPVKIFDTMLFCKTMLSAALHIASAIMMMPQFSKRLDTKNPTTRAHTIAELKMVLACLSQKPPGITRRTSESSVCADCESRCREK